MDGAHEVFERALAAERLRNAHQLVTFRFLSLSAFLALALVFRLLEPTWIGPVTTLAVYWAAAGAVLWADRRSERLTRLSGMSIPLVDMPMILFVVLGTMSQLEAAGSPEDAHALRLWSAVFYVLFVYLASFSLETRYVYIAAMVGVFCQTILIYVGGTDYGGGTDIFNTVLVAFSICMAGVLGANASRRTTRLVRAVSAEELRRERLGRYFPPQIAEHMESSADSLATGESREVTILFCDIRGFTSLSEKLSSEEIVALLNDFHTRMVETIFDNDGTLDKFMGDGIMAYFGAPVAQPDHATRAVHCSLAMQRELARLNEERGRRGEGALRMGIGVHTGTVVLGDIGAPRRRDYTIIGDAVNVAAKIEQLTKDLNAPVLVSEDTYRRVDDGTEFSAAEPVHIKGKTEPVRCYLPLGLDAWQDSPRTCHNHDLP